MAYEPHVFPIRWNTDGKVVESFAPDFYLTEMDLYVELTTLKQSLVRRKNRKLRHLRELYPMVRIKLFYARDFKALLLKYGRLDAASSLIGSDGQPPPRHVRAPEDESSGHSPSGRRDGGRRAPRPEPRRAALAELRQEEPRACPHRYWSRMWRKCSSIKPACRPRWPNWASASRADYEGRQITLVSVLKGALPFMADLMRAITVPVRIDLMEVSSYGASTESSGLVRIIKDLSTSIEGQDVLIVEDIIDTGLTLNYLTSYLAARIPASLRICTLLDKPARRLVEIELAYRGFEIPDRFVVGYGLDYGEVYRNLPYIGVLKPEVYGGE